MRAMNTCKGCKMKNNPQRKRCLNCKEDFPRTDPNYWIECSECGEQSRARRRFCIECNEENQNYVYKPRGAHGGALRRTPKPKKTLVQVPTSDSENGSSDDANSEDNDSSSSSGEEAPPPKKSASKKKGSVGKPKPKEKPKDKPKPKTTALGSSGGKFSMPKGGSGKNDTSWLKKKNAGGDKRGPPAKINIPGRGATKKADKCYNCGYNRNEVGYSKCKQCFKPAQTRASQRKLTGMGGSIPKPEKGKFVACDNCGAQNLKGYKLCAECFAPPDDGGDDEDLSWMDN